MVAELRQVVANDPDYPAVLLFFQSAAADGETFFRQHWPEARAVADPERRFYAALSIRRGRLNQLLNADLIRRATQAAFKGHSLGRTQGDPMMMPGVFLARADGAVLWHHPFAHAGDNPAFADIPQFAGLTMTDG